MARRNRTTNKKPADPNKIENSIAERILELLEKAELPPWHRPWRLDPHAKPCNAVTKRPYRGINVWLTRMSQELAGYRDHRWLTYRQAQQARGHVLKGEQATKIVFWKMIPRKNDDRGRENTFFPLAVEYSVFNLEQTAGCDLPPLPEPQEQTEAPDPIAEAEAIIAAMPNPPRFETYATDNTPAHYNPKADLVRVPDRHRYDQLELYYNTVYHELTHATGHPNRLNRFEPEKLPNPHEYALEELVAGMGSAMLTDLAGIGRATIEADAAYIKQWSDAIRADRSIILAAAQQSQKAVDYITNTVPEHAADGDT